MNLSIDYVRRIANGNLDAERRSELGQYMTPSAIADFMAALFDLRDNIRLLDAGAGVGSLTAAFLDKALKKDLYVDVETWEIDSTLRQYLKDVLEHYEQQGKGKTTYRINSSDFIEDAVFAIQMGNTNSYTHAILNPPYKKINAQSKHRKLLREVGIETVNLYTAFVSLSILLLEDGGEIVAIMPRSFCNGTYYKSFRKMILSTCSIKQIHLFESRSTAFREDDVLQENVIIHLAKRIKSNRVIISNSKDASFKNYKQSKYDFTIIVKDDDKEQFIHIPLSREHTITPKLCSKRLQELGLDVSTGPVVDFRLKEYWCDIPSEGTVPLLYPHHFIEGHLKWPLQHKKPNALQTVPEIKKLLMPSGHYVLVKRFSSKEERRRIVAYYLSPDALPFQLIGFENHFNVFHVKKHGLGEYLARGLSLFLNSTILDRHFRVFSGHTQVNATDLRNILYPKEEELIRIGKRSIGQLNDQATIDYLIVCHSRPRDSRRRQPV